VREESGLGGAWVNVEPILTTAKSVAILTYSSSMVKLRTNMEMKITNGGRGGCNDDMFTSCCWLTGGNQAVACRGDQSTTTKRVGTNNFT
jgi:hypothetical protein